MAVSMIGLDTALANAIQDGTIERVAYEKLIAATRYRMDVAPEVWPATEGDTLRATREGLLPVSITPLTPGTDPTPKRFARETWLAELLPYGDSVDHFIPDDYVARLPEFVKKIKAISENAAITIDRIIRARMFRAYCGGNTCTTALAAIGAGQIHVASASGFSQINDADGIPIAVSATNPLTITFGGAEPANTVTAITPDDPADTDMLGPAWLTLGAVLTVGVAAREAVLAANRSRIVIAGGGNSVDAIGGADTLTYAEMLNATSWLESVDIPPHDDGTYHCHLSPFAEAQILSDPAVQRLIQDVRFPSPFANSMIGRVANATLIKNNRAPNPNNVGTTVSTGAGSSVCAPELGIEPINNGAVNLAYTIITGKGSIYEKYVPPMAMQPNEGVSTARERTFQASNGTVSLNSERVKMIIRPPMDRMNELMAISWSFKGDWPVPSDITTGTQRFRRAVVIIHATPV